VFILCRWNKSVTQSTWHEQCAIKLCRFIGQLLRLLVCNNEKFGPQIQKHVKELVGHELNSHIYPILFDRFKIYVDKFFDSSGQVSICNLCSDRSVLLIRIFCSIV
jgi:hypothetical protein